MTAANCSTLCSPLAMLTPVPRLTLLIRTHDKNVSGFVGVANVEIGKHALEETRTRRDGQAKFKDR